MTTATAPVVRSTPEPPPPTVEIHQMLMRLNRPKKSSATIEDVTDNKQIAAKNYYHHWLNRWESYTTRSSQYPLT